MVGTEAGEGGGSVSGGGVSSTWVETNYISKAFFNRLFTIHGTVTETDPDTQQEVTTEVVILPNDTSTTLANIEAKKGLWTNEFLSALGMNSGGGGGGTVLLEPLNSINNAGLAAHPSQAGQTVVWNGSAWVYGATGGSGTVTSVAVTTPSSSHLYVNSSNSATITTNGTFALSFESGYGIPLTSDVTKGVTAFGWGDHASVGYWKDGNGNHPTTLSGYGITDAKIASGVITLGSNTITPWTNSNHPTTLSGYGITDAKFGTAGSDYVPITLGSTTKNVLLSTALSGYATQTWVTTQLSSYLPLSGGTMSNTNVVTNMNADLLDGLHKGSFMQNFVEGTADLNDLTDSGSYRLGNGNTNKPSNDNYAQMLVVKGGGDTIAQMYFPYASTKAYIRTGNPLNASGEWKTWREVAFTDSNVASATKLETARSLWGQSFDGTANVTGNMTSVGSISASGEIKTTSGNAFRLANGNYGVIMRNDGSAFHILLTDSGSAASGSYNSLRPFFINLSTGLVTMKQGLYLIGSNGTYASTSFDSLRIGNGVIMWDSTNNALKVQKYDGTAANLYALGGVSALGFQSGGTSTSISTLNVTSQLNMANESRIYTDESLYIGSPDSNGWVYLADCCSQVGPSKWSIGSDNGAAKFMRVTSPLFYLDDTHYLRYNSGHLQFYNGTSFINLT